MFVIKYKFGKCDKIVAIGQVQYDRHFVLRGWLG